MLEEMVVAAPLPWSSPIYKRVSGIQSFIELGTILLGNCVLCTILAVCLWAFSNIVDLSGPEKRTFNTCSLLLSASLGFGIGFFFDRIGLLARGKILQSEANTAQGVCPFALVLEGIAGSDSFQNI